MMKKILTALAFVAGFSTFAMPDCQETGTVCTAPNQAHSVSGLSVFHECWRYQDTYQCRNQNMVSDCQPLQDKGYSQIGSSCVEHDDSNTCVMYEQKYNCPGKPKTYTEETVYDQSIFCQNGGAGCFDTNAPPDRDSGQAAVMIEAAREAGVYGIGPDRVEVFKGCMEECNIKVLDGTTFKSCCKSTGDDATLSNYTLLGAGVKAADEAGRESIVLGSKYMYDSLYGQLDSFLVDKGLGVMDNWASGLGNDVFSPQFGFYSFTFEFTFANGFQFVGFDPYSFALFAAIMLMQEWLSCDSVERAIVMKRGQNLCVHIETYCSRKVLKVCVEKKGRHCCFNSRLAEIISRQGRAQLRIPMNSRGGFNRAQLQALDFSRIDLSEFIADVMPKNMPASTMSDRVQQTINKKVQSYYDQ